MAEFSKWLEAGEESIFSLETEKNLRAGILSRLQLSTTDRMAATRGPACWLPMCIQFLRPSATRRIEFSARLLLSSRRVF
jgi:hypothetical protein